MIECNYAYIVNNKTITIYGCEDGVVTVDRTHGYADSIIGFLKEGSYAEALELADVATALVAYGSGKITVDNGSLLLNGAIVNNVLSERIVEMWKNGDDISAMVAFMNNLHDNPSARATQELYRFLEANSLPITNDGHFLAYKNVNENYRDRHSNTFDNSVGSVCEMVRNQVQDDPDVTCSTGLHFCSMHYLTNMWGTSGHTMIVKINPRDVVSIPTDYQDSKGRCCRYEVIDEHKTASSGLDHESFEQPVVYTKEEQELYSEAYDQGYNDGYGDADGSGASDNYYDDDDWQF